jgi:hypothetical protein
VKQKREQKILIVLTLKGRDSKTLYGYYFDAGRQNLRQRRVGSVGSSTFRWCRGPGLHHASNRISGFLGGLTAFTSEATMTERRRETWRIFRNRIARDWTRKRDFFTILPKRKSACLWAHQAAALAIGSG